MTRLADSFPNPLLILTAVDSGVTGSASKLRKRIGNLAQALVVMHSS